MKILIDHCLPGKKLAHELQEYEVVTVHQKGWDNYQNNQLLSLAENEFDLFITGDQNIEYQQNLQSRQIRIITLVLYRTNINHILPPIPQIKQAIDTMQLGELLVITEEHSSS